MKRTDNEEINATEFVLETSFSVGFPTVISIFFPLKKLTQRYE
jgi:hypothetical protein